LLQVPKAGRIPICCSSWMVEAILVITKVSEAMLATNSGFTKLIMEVV